MKKSESADQAADVLRSNPPSANDCLAWEHAGLMHDTPISSSGLGGASPVVVATCCAIVVEPTLPLHLRRRRPALELDQSLPSCIADTIQSSLNATLNERPSVSMTDFCHRIRQAPNALRKSIITSIARLEYQNGSLVSEFLLLQLTTSDEENWLRLGVECTVLGPTKGKVSAYLPTHASRTPD